MIIFACCKMDQNKDVIKWKKEVIAFEYSKGHNLENVAEFAIISHNIVKFIFKQDQLPKNINAGPYILIFEQAFQKNSLIRVYGEDCSEVIHANMCT